VARSDATVNVTMKQMVRKHVVAGHREEVWLLIRDGDVVRMSRRRGRQWLDGVGVARCWPGGDDANKGCAIMCCATERGRVMASTAIGGGTMMVAV